MEREVRFGIRVERVILEGSSTNKDLVKACTNVLTSIASILRDKKWSGARDLAVN